MALALQGLQPAYNKMASMNKKNKTELIAIATRQAKDLETLHEKYTSLKENKDLLQDVSKKNHEDLVKEREEHAKTRGQLATAKKNLTEYENKVRDLLKKSSGKVQVFQLVWSLFCCFPPESILIPPFSLVSFKEEDSRLDAKAKERA